MTCKSSVLIGLSPFYLLVRLIWFIGLRFMRPWCRLTFSFWIISRNWSWCWIGFILVEIRLIENDFKGWVFTLIMLFRTLHLKQGAAPSTEINWSVPVPSLAPFLYLYSQQEEIRSTRMLLTYITMLKSVLNSLAHAPPHDPALTKITCTDILYVVLMWNEFFVQA